jgi:hypothetical protein
MSLSQVSWTEIKREPAPVLELEILTLYDSLRLPLLRYSVSFGTPVADGEDVILEAFWRCLIICEKDVRGITSAGGSFR